MSMPAIPFLSGGAGGGYGIQGSPSTGWSFFRPAGTPSTERIASFGIGVTDLAFIRADGVMWARRTTDRSTLGDSRVLVLRDVSGLNNSRYEIGLGYHTLTDPDGNYQPVVIGHRITDGAGNTKGNVYIATRDATTNTAPTERFEVESNGDVNINTSAGAAQLNIKSSATSKGALSLEAAGGSTAGILFDQTGNYGYLDYDKVSSEGIRLSALVKVRLGVNTNADYGTSTFTEVANVTGDGMSLGLPLYRKQYTVGTLPSAAIAGGDIFVSDETGGPVPAFSDGANWRRCTDRTIVS